MGSLNGNALRAMSAISGNPEYIYSYRVLPPLTHKRRTAHLLFELHGLVKAIGRKIYRAWTHQTVQETDLTVTISKERLNKELRVDVGLSDCGSRHNMGAVVPLLA
jgi:hypothetical protein